MRWTSDRASIERGDVSALALFETFLAMAIAHAVVRYTGTVKYVAISATLAPFLLLRTECSIALGLAWGRRVTDVAVLMFDWYTNFDPAIAALMFFILTPLLLASTVVAITVVKIIATIVTVFWQPYEVLQAVTQNWRKVVFSMDSRTLPEVLPGVEKLNLKTDDSLSLIRISAVFGEDFDWSSDIGQWFPLFWLVVLAGILFLPAMAYRFSLKSTAIVWSPLLWIVGPVSQAVDLRKFLRHVIQDTAYKLSRVYSVFVILLFIVKIYLYISIGRLNDIMISVPGWDILRHYVVPDAIPSWHITAALNAGLAWLFLFEAERHIDDLASNVDATRLALQRRFKVWLTIRTLLSIYTAVFTLYITWQNATRLASRRFASNGSPGERSIPLNPDPIPHSHSTVPP